MNTHPETTTALEQASDTFLFGWNDLPGIVSIWADRDGHATLWQRLDRQIVCTRARYRPWVFAASLDDLAHLGNALVASEQPLSATVPFSYAELKGDSTRCRFLITARSGRTLERELLAGASRRFGRAIRSLYDLQADYYRVGPVEQYLMATGQAYFRGLVYDDLHRMQIDFETTALDPQRGRIFLAAVRDTRGLARTIEAPAPEDEPRLLAELCALIRERDPDIIENHNLFGFDLPFLEARAEAYGIPLDLGRPGGPAGLTRFAEGPAGDDNEPKRYRYTLAGRELIDTLDAVRRHDFVTRDLPSHRLKDVARHFGIASPERVYLPGEAVLETYRNDPELVRRYALDDVAEVDGLSRRLMVPTFALAGMAPRRYERLAYAGPAMGILEPMLVRAYLRAGAAPPRPGYAAGSHDTPHAGGALHLFAVGVAQQVVKADIASLYPSLMIRYAIGPACDPLGALLAIVGRLTELRLEHKSAAREAPAGSLEAGYHNAMQAAMKLIINSAYGYLGAGSMALFADRDAADEITRRGREVLSHVVEQLRGRGMALIEADTDGVYFAAPQGWNEAQERALVAEVAATLPTTIRLEYEGRYRAMLSHEVKNYALLTYDDHLIVRGVALRSSRSEPFGDRFLRRALRCAMQGDIAGLRAAYEETLAAVRQRSLPAADLATRVRLSKTPTAYSESQRRQREAAYEALLAAGRSDWARGERVRYYRTSAGTHMWLPDETDEPGQAAEPAYSTHDDARDYDADYYIDTLLTSYAARLRKAFEPEDFDQLFRSDTQLGLFDTPLEQIQPRWIRCTEPTL